MAKAKVVHSGDAVTVIFKGDRANPEPATGVVKFPGGHVEVSRCSDGSYWAHLYVVAPVNIVGSRIDYAPDAETGINSVADLPHHQLVQKIALRISNNVNHFDPDK